MRAAVVIRPWQLRIEVLLVKGWMNVNAFMHMQEFFVRYPEPNSVPQRCLDELCNVMDQPQVRYYMLQLLERRGRKTVVFKASGSETVHVDVSENGTDELVFGIGNDIMYSAEVPLVEYLRYVLPRYCTYAMEDDPEGRDPEWWRHDALVRPYVAPTGTVLGLEGLEYETGC
jgi:hypothetical protein